MPPTPFMGLTLPTVGVTLGPEWATEVNAAFSQIDSHNHTTGRGVPIPTAGLALNADLPFNQNNATNLRSTIFINNASPLSLPTDVGSLYVSGGNLYYNNTVGQQVQITQGAGLDASTVGGFGGDYGTSTASAFYTSATSTFTFWQAPNDSALMDTGAITIHPTTSSVTGITVTAPVGLSTSYTATLPNVLPSPGNPGVLTIDSSGNISASTFTVQNLLPPGVMLPFAGPLSSIPSGFLACDASMVSRTTYAALFAAIGVAWGNGDGSTTFTLPESRGLFFRGVSGASGFDPDASSRATIGAGSNSGNNVGSFQSDQVGPHTHSISDPGHTHHVLLTGGGPGIHPIQIGGVTGGGAADPTTNMSAAATGITILSNGNNQTNPSNVYVNYIIKY